MSTIHGEFVCKRCGCRCASWATQKNLSGAEHIVHSCYGEWRVLCSLKSRLLPLLMPSSSVEKPYSTASEIGNIFCAHDPNDLWHVAMAILRRLYGTRECTCSWNLLCWRCWRRRWTCLGTQIYNVLHNVCFSMCYSKAKAYVCVNVLCVCAC